MTAGGAWWARWTRDPEHRRRVAALHGASVFAGLPSRLLGRLASRVFEKRYATGDLVFREGDPAKALFVVLEGAVAISRGGPDGEQVIRTLGPGACFGELALIDDFPRSATARVAAAGRLLVLYKSDFDALIDGSPRIGLVTLRNLLRMVTAYVRAATPVNQAAGGIEPPGSGNGAPGEQPP